MSRVDYGKGAAESRRGPSVRPDAATYTLDLGSHSVKLYEQQGESFRLVRTATWEILDAEISADQLGEFLQRFLNGVPDLESVTALATAAFRRRPNLGETLATACQFLGISVSIIDQESEADLMRRALARESVLASLDAINVGGGSIQVTSPTGLTHLLPFGIADLNRRFGLSKGPSEREVTACREFVAGQLPDWLGEFAYTGGERTYLESFGVPLQGIWCSADDFEIFAARMERWSNHDLESRSPYDARWMSGAIASNSIVIACLQRSGVHRFAPVDLNIAYGNS